MPKSYGTAFTESEALFAAMGDEPEDPAELQQKLRDMPVERLRELRDGASRLIRFIDAERGRRVSEDRDAQG